MSSDRSSNNALPVLLFLAVLGLGGWNAWLTLENQKLKDALGGDLGDGNTTELAERVDALEASMENGLVLSIINPSRGDTVLSAPIRAISKGGGAASKAGDKLPPLSASLSGGNAKISGKANDDGKLFPDVEPSEDDPNAPFDFSTGTSQAAGSSADSSFPDNDFPRDRRGSKSSSFNDILSGSDPSLVDDDEFGPEFEGPMPRPEGSMTAREPGPSSGTFGDSQTLVGGGGDEPYLFELSVEALLNPSFISIAGGSGSGVRPGAKFIVFRGSREIGRVTVQEARERTSIAEITEYVGGITFQQGDRLVPE